MSSEIVSIGLEKLVGHPGNANVMSGGVFRKLVRNIERTGMYEPIVVRHHPRRKGRYEIINGHHRVKALERLGYTKVDCVVWDVDDEQADILLATLNRLCGRDVLDKKLALLRRLRERMGSGELGKLILPTASQIERLTALKLPSVSCEAGAKGFASALVFFVNDEQKEIIEKALGLAVVGDRTGTRAARRAAALAEIAELYEGRRKGCGRLREGGGN